MSLVLLKAWSDPKFPKEKGFSLEKIPLGCSERAQEWEFPWKKSPEAPNSTPKSTSSFPNLSPSISRPGIPGFFPFFHLLVAQGSQLFVAQGQDPRALVGEFPMDLVVVAGTLGQLRKRNPGDIP